MYTIGKKWHRIETVGRKPLSKVVALYKKKNQHNALFKLMF